MYLLYILNSKWCVQNKHATRVFWSHTIEGERISFDDTPFTVAAIHKLHCQFGNHYYKEHSANCSKSIRLQGTQKIGCSPHIHIQKLHEYPEFNVPPYVTASLGTRQLKEVRAKRLGELKETLARGNKLELQIKYFVLLLEQKLTKDLTQLIFSCCFIYRKSTS